MKKVFITGAHPDDVESIEKIRALLAEQDMELVEEGHPGAEAIMVLQANPEPPPLPNLRDLAMTGDEYHGKLMQKVNKETKTYRSKKDRRTR